MPSTAWIQGDNGNGRGTKSLIQKHLPTQDSNLPISNEVIFEGERQGWNGRVAEDVDGPSLQTCPPCQSSERQPGLKNASALNVWQNARTSQPRHSFALCSERHSELGLSFARSPCRSEELLENLQSCVSRSGLHPEVFTPDVVALFAVRIFFFAALLCSESRSAEESFYIVERATPSAETEPSTVSRPSPYVPLLLDALIS